MHYFLTNKFEYNISGIEHAQLYRSDIFKKMGITSKIISFEYTPSLLIFLKRHGYSTNISLNIFDYWQGALEYENIKKPNFSSNDSNINIEYYDATQLRSAGITESVIKNIYYYNDGKLIEADEWSIRGFCSKKVIYDTTGSVMKTYWYSTKGEIVLEESAGSIEIYPANPQYSEKNNIFYSWDELKAAWLDNVVLSDSDSFFYIDRGEYVVPLLLLMQHRAKKNLVVLHSAHTVNRQDPFGSQLNDIVQVEVDHPDLWDGFITSTKEQAYDFKKRTGMKTFEIPVAFVDNSIAINNIIKRIEQDKISIVYFSRISREKRIEDAIQAMVYVVRRYPNTQLNIYGYVTDSVYNNELHELISELGLDRVVHLRPYTPYREEILQKSDIFLLTSEYEGFNMSLLEAARQGVPTVSYDVLYGPKSLIMNLKNGVLVKDGNIQNLGQEINNLISCPKELIRCQENGINNSEKFYGAASVSKKWIEFFHHLNIPVRESIANMVVADGFDQHNALQPSYIGIRELSEKLGYQILKFPNSLVEIDDFISKVNIQDTIVIPYPSFVGTMDTALMYDLKLVQSLKKKGTKISLLLGDSLILREWDKFMKTEFELLNMADVIIVPTREMKLALTQIGISKHMTTPFYFYPLPDTGNENYNHSIPDKNKIIYTGNLSKATFLNTIKCQNVFDVYGPNPSPKLLANSTVSYHGELDFYNLNHCLKSYSGFGLVWDGEIVPGWSKESRYTRYNMPYKSIQYLSCGVPLVAWEGSSLGQLIKRKNIGITIVNLNELFSKLQLLSEEEIRKIQSNVINMQEELRKNERLMDILLESAGN